jgi:hypothetical protein
MKKVFRLVLISGALALAGSAFSQTTGNSMARIPTGAATEPNMLELGLGFDAAYDSNVFNTDPAQGEALFSLRPRVAWNLARSRWSSLFGYTGMFSRGTRFDYYNRSSNAFNTSLNYQLSKRLSFTLYDSFLRSIDPLYSANNFDVGPVVPGSPNPSYFGPPAVRLSNSAGLSADYRLDARSDISFAGNYNLNRFDETSGPSLRDTDVVNGMASYKHAFSARTKAGITYDATKITASSGVSVLSQRILLTDDITISPTIAVSLFGGPDYIANHFNLAAGGVVVPVTDSKWSWSAGGTFRWVHSAYTTSASVVHQVSDGGGLSTPVQVTSFTFSGGRRFARRYSASLNAAYTLNDRLVASTATLPSAHYGFVGASLNRDFSRNWSISLSYDRMETLRGEGVVSSNWIGRDRVTIGINYNFSHPLGR